MLKPTMKSIMNFEVIAAQTAPGVLAGRRMGVFSLSSSLTGALLGLVLAGAAWAGPQQASSDLTDQSLADLMNIKVYGAARYIQPASDAPVSVTVVTQDEI